MNGIDYIEHHGIKGQKWYVRRFQNEDGSLTALGRRRLGYGTRKAGEKKNKLLSNPIKAAKKSGYLSTKDLKSAIEKAELANKLREHNTTAKERARNARLSTIERLSEVRQKARLNKQEAKKQKELAEINRQAAKAKEAENKGKASAEKWKNRATKLKSIVDVGKALKTLSDDAGITNKKSGETILGGILAGMGIKTLDKSKDKDDDNKKDSNKSSNPVINITNIMPGSNQNTSASTVQSAVKTVTQTVAAAPISTAKNINASSNGVFSFGAPNKASSVFDASSFKDVDFATIGGKVIPLVDWNIGSSPGWDTVKKRRKDGQPDRRYKPLEVSIGSRLWSDNLEDALIHGELSFDDMLMCMNDDYIEHHGINGQKWGIRRYQNPDGSLTELGKKHYAIKSLRSENRRSRKEIKGIKDEHFKGSFASNLSRDAKSLAHPLRLYNPEAVASMDFYRREREFENDPRTKAARSAIEKRKQEIKNLKLSMKEIRRKGANDNYIKPDANRVTDAEDNYVYYKKQYDEWNNSRKRYLSENPGEKFPEEHEVKWAKEAMDRAEKEYNLVRKLKKKNKAVS